MRSIPVPQGVITDVVWTSARLGHAAALNVGIRRTLAPVVVVLGSDVEMAGDVVTPLVTALEDPRVAVAGPFGLVSGDLSRFDPAPDGAVDVDAIDGALQAFRRADYVERGPLDERFVTAPSLDVWWSLVLRDGDAEPGVEADPGRAADLGRDADASPVHRRAVVVPGLPVRRIEPPVMDGYADAAARSARRNQYRVLKRFAARRDLLVTHG